VSLFNLVVGTPRTLIIFPFVNSFKIIVLFCFVLVTDRNDVKELSEGLAKYLKTDPSACTCGYSLTRGQHVDGHYVQFIDVPPWERRYLTQFMPSIGPSLRPHDPTSHS